MFTSPTSVIDTKNDSSPPVKSNASYSIPSDASNIIPSDDDIRNRVRSLLSTFSPDQYEHFSFKDVIATLSEEFKTNLLSKSTLIQDAIVDYAAQIDYEDNVINDDNGFADADGEDDEDEDEDEDQDDEIDGKATDGYEDDDERANNPLNDAFDDSDDENSVVSQPMKKQRSDDGLVKLAPILSTFLGIEEGTKNQIGNKIWEYVNTHQLQDKSDNRYVNLDVNLKKILPEIGNKRVHVNNMAKIISKHFLK